MLHFGRAYLSYYIQVKLFKVNECLNRMMQWTLNLIEYMHHRTFSIFEKQSFWKLKISISLESFYFIEKFNCKAWLFTSVIEISDENVIQKERTFLNWVFSKGWFREGWERRLQKDDIRKTKIKFLKRIISELTC